MYLSMISQRSASTSKDMGIFVLRLVDGAETLLGWGCDIRVMPTYVSKWPLLMNVSQGLRSVNAEGEVQSCVCIHTGPDVNQNISRQWTVFVTPRYSICHRCRLFPCQTIELF